jgi:hypothetical protein
MKLLVAAVVVAVACAAGCGSKSPETSTTPAAPSAGAAVALPDVAFDKLDHDQRIAFMKQKVMPAMKPVFANHDSTKFAELHCTNCHGEQAKEGHFDMPNPKLPKLNFNDMSKFKKEDIEWMEKEVLPTMAKLLDMPMYSKDNPKGFGCLGCHTMEGQ